MASGHRIQANDSIKETRKLLTSISTAALRSQYPLKSLS